VPEMGNQSKNTNIAESIIFEYIFRVSWQMPATRCLMSIIFKPIKLFVFE
jgi:hypothetical protein